jgi:hypothetical protein
MPKLRLLMYWWEAYHPVLSQDIMLSSVRPTTVSSGVVNVVIKPAEKLLEMIISMYLSELPSIMGVKLQ